MEIPTGEYLVGPGQVPGHPVRSLVTPVRSPVGPGRKRFQPFGYLWFITVIKTNLG